MLKKKLSVNYLQSPTLFSCCLPLIDRQRLGTNDTCEMNTKVKTWQPCIVSIFLYGNKGMMIACKLYHKILIKSPPPPPTPCLLGTAPVYRLGDRGYPRTAIRISFGNDHPQ